MTVVYDRPVTQRADDEWVSSIMKGDRAGSALDISGDGFLRMAPLANTVGFQPRAPLESQTSPVRRSVSTG
jgi:hypothetical protein